MTDTIATPQEALEAARATLFYDAVRFAFWACGEGICPADGEDAEDPGDFLTRYSEATGDRDWETLAGRMRALSSRIAPDPALREARLEVIACEGQADEALAALRLALPVMRRGVWDYLPNVCLPRRDIASICPFEWEEITADIAAIRAATAIVGPQPDMDGVDTAWLNAAIDVAPKGDEG